MIKIDIDSVLRKRAPRHYRFIPRWLIRQMERIIHQDGLNGILERNDGKNGVDFCRAVIDDLEISYDVEGADNLPADRRIIIVSNHPLGALDGIIMIDWVASVYGRDVKFVVNDLLMAVEPLRDVFLPINKHGRQTRGNTEAIDTWLAGDAPLIVFPAGLVSRRQDDTIKDLKWQKMFVNKSIEYQRDVIPVYFKGRNSSFFYNFAKLRERIGLKFNIEMILLPREIFRSRRCRYTIRVGRPVSYTTLEGGGKAMQEADRVKGIVYNLERN